MDWADIDAVVIGKAPDMFEGVMMPELYLAPALGAVGKPMLRVHTAGSVGGSTALVAAHLVASGTPRAGPHRGLREAVGLRRHVGPVGSPALLGAAAGRGGRLLRPHHPRLHAPLGRARPHRDPGGGEGPAAGAQEPLRPPAHRGHLLRDGEGLDHAVGPGPLPRDVPVLGRRGRHGAGRRSGWPTRRARAARRRGSTAWPCARSPPCSPGATR